MSDGLRLLQPFGGCGNGDVTGPLNATTKFQLTKLRLCVKEVKKLSLQWREDACGTITILWLDKRFSSAGVLPRITGIFSTLTGPPKGTPDLQGVAD